MATDVLLVSLGSTHGWRVADDALAGSMRRAGASVELVRAEPPREVRTFALTDLGWARAARRAAGRRAPARRGGAAPDPDERAGARGGAFAASGGGRRPRPGGGECGGRARRRGDHLRERPRQEGPAACARRVGEGAPRRRGAR